MASILRQIVAGPRARHPEAGLDLCYVTDYIVATSGPSSSYPQRAYRNPTEDLVKWLDDKHFDKWSIWEFRAEGTGYSDEEVHNRILHFPWPDHHPPPFKLIPKIMATMRDWLKGPDSEPERIAVVHCKAGKGRSGTIAVSYLISEENWSVDDAKDRFTARRMRSGFGPGISIPSQVRWIGYVDWWAKHGKLYVERPVEILELHIWGLRDGVRVAVEGYVEEGKVIKTFHTFSRHEKTVMDRPSPDVLSPVQPSIQTPVKSDPPSGISKIDTDLTSPSAPSTPLSPAVNTLKSQATYEQGAIAALFRPARPIILETSDVSIDFERRNNAKYGLTMVTSVAHVWFNTYFESQFALQKSAANENQPKSATPNAQAINPLETLSSGVFTIHWDAMDGVKGSSRKGRRAFDKLQVVWRSVDPETGEAAPPTVVAEPAPGEEAEQTGPVKQKTGQHLRFEKDEIRKNLGLRTQSPLGRDISRSSSPISAGTQEVVDDDSEVGIQPYVPGDEGTDTNAASSPKHKSDGASEEKEDVKSPTAGQTGEVKGHADSS